MPEKFQEGMPHEEGNKETENFEKIKQLILDKLGPKIVAQAQDIVRQMHLNPEYKGKTATIYKVPHREELTEKVFFPNFGEFTDLVAHLPVVDSMVKFVDETKTPVDFNVHYHIFENEATTLTTNRGARSVREVAKYKNHMQKQGEIVQQKLGFSEKKSRPILNPLIFTESSTKDQLALKILDDMMSCQWQYGSTLELGDKNIYDTGSFTDALADRLTYVTKKWDSMSEDDRKAWIEGKFTHSEDAHKGFYDTIMIASDNYRTG